MSTYLIIGAGPAGLATAVALKQAGVKFEVVDAGNKVGGVWDINRKETPMYTSAHFISSKSLSGFRDFPMPTSYPDYPSHALVHAYIEDYACHHQLEPYIRFHTKVISARPQGQHWEVGFDDQSCKTYKGVICATGITWHLNLPKISGNFSGEFIHSFHYK
ncbi:MAG: NAD(P)/FAD-dependent oxidoreductase, partial [Bacteroidota bacterium]